MIKSLNTKNPLNSKTVRGALDDAAYIIREIAHSYITTLEWAFNYGLKLMQIISIFYLLLLLGRTQNFIDLNPAQLELLRIWGRRFQPEVHLLFIWCAFFVPHVVSCFVTLFCNVFPIDIPGEIEQRHMVVMRQFAAHRWCLSSTADGWLALGPDGEEKELRHWQDVQSLFADVEKSA